MILKPDSLDIEDARSVLSVDSEAPLLGDDVAPAIADFTKIHDEADQGFSGSSWAAFFKVTCVVAGTSVFGLPYAIRQGGFIGVALITSFMIITLHTSIILIKCLYYDGKTRLSSYSDIGYHAYGNIGKYFFVGILNNAILLGFPIFTLIIAGQNLDNLITLHYGIHLGVRTWICVSAALIAVPFTFMKSLKDAVIISMFGALSTLLCVVAIAALACRDFQEQPTHNLYNFSMSFATISISYGGNSVFPHVEESMRRRKDWNKVVIAALFTCGIMYLIVALSGYYVFGDCKIEPFRGNHHEGPILTIATIFITIDVLLTAPLLLTSFASDAEKILKITSHHHTTKIEFLLRASFRLCIMILCSLTAIFVPFFGDMIGLLGTLAMCLLIFVLPTMFYLRLIGWRSLSTWELLWNLFVILVGLVGCVVGTRDAVIILLQDFHKMN